jgi:hypothetical protein
MFHVSDGLFFERLEDGKVRIRKTTDGRDGSPVVFEQVIDAGSWSSVVLSMSAFDERPNDWHVFMEYHLGKTDIITPHKK